MHEHAQIAGIRSEPDHFAEPARCGFAGRGRARGGCGFEKALEQATLAGKLGGGLT
jgi:hypothetical protein